MNKTFERRHSRWYEQILFSGLFQLLLGFAVVVIVPAWLRWPEEVIEITFSDNAWNTNIANAVSFIVFFIAVRYLRSFPGAQSLGYAFSTLAIIWLIAVAVLFFYRLDYTRQVLFISYLIANTWLLLGFFIHRKYRVLKLAVVPVGKALYLTDTASAAMNFLEQPDLAGRRYDAVVADFHAEELPAEWERFLAQCTLAGIPVYHYKQLMESLTGRVKIDHLSENEFGSLQPSVFYSALKRVVDSVVAILLLPLTLPFLIIVGLWIKLDSKGPALFVQERMGFRGKIFKVYKFRSMYSNQKGRGFTEGEDDPRITRVGRVIRKYRIDELPQLLNVIKGDMSFIGPRPESKRLSDWYERDVPFFSYRHIVRPGISGWAQVEQGYAAEIDGMNKKLEYDFYYIKNFSLWLDILIVFKTIKTVFTGSGAR